tara:strand:+ start:740 stop:913 length:174 start_codon:yes stop_codon:yes gene_type:complete
MCYIKNKKPHFISEVKMVKVEDLLYKNELDVIYYKVVRVSLGGKIIEYLTTKREIYC